jgi:hypothetical protein
MVTVAFPVLPEPPDGAYPFSRSSEVRLETPISPPETAIADPDSQTSAVFFVNVRLFFLREKPPVGLVHPKSR